MIKRCFLETLAITGENAPSAHGEDKTLKTKIMNIGLELQVFSLSDSDLNTPEGIEIPLKDCILIPYTFYTIDYVTADRSDSRFTVIGSGGEDFTVNAAYGTVKKKIEQIRLLRYN